MKQTNHYQFSIKILAIEKALRHVEGVGNLFEALKIAKPMISYEDQISRNERERALGRAVNNSLYDVRARIKISSQ